MPALDLNMTLVRKSMLITVPPRTDTLCAYNVADGSFLASAPCKENTSAIASLCVDPLTACVYLCASTGFRTTSIVSFRWNGKTFVFEGEIATLEDLDVCFNLFVCVSSTRHLVVAQHLSSTLRIISLLDCRLVFTHTLNGIRVENMAVDPSGFSLVVSDANTSAIHVLPWPL
jgi:hypothetical protein